MDSDDEVFIGELTEQEFSLHPRDRVSIRSRRTEVWNVSQDTECLRNKESLENYNLDEDVTIDQNNHSGIDEMGELSNINKVLEGERCSNDVQLVEGCNTVLDGVETPPSSNNVLIDTSNNDVEFQNVTSEKVLNTDEKVPYFVESSLRELQICEVNNTSDKEIRSGADDIEEDSLEVILGNGGTAPEVMDRTTGHSEDNTVGESTGCTVLKFPSGIEAEEGTGAETSGKKSKSWQRDSLTDKEKSENSASLFSESEDAELQRASLTSPTQTQEGASSVASPIEAKNVKEPSWFNPSTCSFFNLRSPATTKGNSQRPSVLGETYEDLQLISPPPPVNITLTQNERLTNFAGSPIHNTVFKTRSLLMKNDENTEDEVTGCEDIRSTCTTVIRSAIQEEYEEVESMDENLAMDESTEYYYYVGPTPCNSKDHPQEPLLDHSNITAGCTDFEIITVNVIDESDLIDLPITEVTSKNEDNVKYNSPKSTEDLNELDAVVEQPCEDSDIEDLQHEEACVNHAPTNESTSTPQVNKTLTPQLWPHTKPVPEMTDHQLKLLRQLWGSPESDSNSESGSPLAALDLSTAQQHQMPRPQTSSRTSIVTLDLSVDCRIPLGSYHAMESKPVKLEHFLEERQEVENVPPSPKEQQQTRSFKYQKTPMKIISHKIGVVNTTRDSSRTRSSAKKEEEAKKPPSIKSKMFPPVSRLNLPNTLTPTCIPVIAKMGPSSAKKLQRGTTPLTTKEVKKKFFATPVVTTKKAWNLQSPVARYINEDPAQPLVQIVRPKDQAITPTRHQGNLKLEEPKGSKSVVLSPEKVPAAQYRIKSQAFLKPAAVPILPAAKSGRFFPSPYTPKVIKHEGPRKAIPGASHLSVSSTRSKLPVASFGERSVDKSTIEMVEVKKTDTLFNPIVSGLKYSHK